MVAAAFCSACQPGVLAHVLAAFSTWLLEYI